MQRVSSAGDLSYEIFYHQTDQLALWESLWSVGQTIRLCPFGMRTIMSLRSDRFFGSWMRDFSRDYTAAETGLDRFIAWDKNADFIGKALALAEREKCAKRTLVVFAVDTDDTDLIEYASI